MIHPNTLADLQSHVATVCQLGNPELACSAGNFTLANQQVAQRVFSDHVTALFVRETHDKRNITGEESERIERKLRRKAERFANRHKIQRRAESSEKCGFVVIGFLVGGLISWLFGKILEALWDWWFKESKSAALAMIGSESIMYVEARDVTDEDND